MSINEPSMSPKIHELTPKSLMHQDVKAQGDIKYKIEIKLDNNTQVFIWSKDNKLPDPHQLSKITQIAQNLNAAGLKGRQTTLHFLYESGKKFELLDVVALKNTTVNKYRDQTGDIIKFITKSNISIFKESYQKAIDQTEKPPTKQGKSIKVDSQKYEALKSQRKPAQKAPLPPSDELDFPKMPTRPPPKLPSRSDFPEKPTRPVPKLPPLSEKEVKLEKLLSEVLDPQDIKQNLPATLSHLCNKYISKEDLGKESLLYGSLNKAKMKIAQRLAIYLKAGIDIKEQSPSLAKRQEATGYEISILKGIEKAFKNNVLSPTSEATFTELKEHNLKVIVSGKNVIIEEKKLGEGSFKLVTAASVYFAMKGPEERNFFVTLKPKPKESIPILQENKITEEKNNPSTSEEESSPTTLHTPTTVHSETEESTPTTVHHESEEESTPTTVHHESEEESTPTTVHHESEEESTPTTLHTPTTVHTETEESTPTTVHHESEEESKSIQSKDEKTGSNTLTSDYLDNAALNLFTKDVSATSVNLKDIPFEKMTLFQMKNRLIELENSPTESKKDISKLQELMIKREYENQLREGVKKDISDQEAYEYEIDITQKLQGPNVVKVHTIIDLANNNKVMVQENATFDLTNAKTGEKVSVGSLKQMGRMNRNGELNKETTIKMMEMLHQAFTGVVRIHKMGYLLRDIKPENILTTKDGKGVLADFGTVVKTKDDPLKSQYGGTVYYSAPETLKYSNDQRWNNIDEKSDVWSCGMTLQNIFMKNGIESHPALTEMKENSSIPIFKSASKAAADYKSMDSKENKQNYESRYPKPKKEISIEHLIWEATKIDPVQRPTMTEFCKKLEEIIKLEKNK